MQSCPGQGCSVFVEDSSAGRILRPGVRVDAGYLTMAPDACSGSKDRPLGLTDVSLRWSSPPLLPWRLLTRAEWPLICFPRFSARWWLQSHRVCTPMERK